MSLPPLDLTLPTDHLRITAWTDPVIDLLGHDLRSTYVERFWLPILGPSTTLLLRHLAAGLDDRPEGFDLPLLDTAHALGLGTKGGRNAPFLRALARAGKFRMAVASGPGAMAVRRRVAPLTRTQVERLAPPLRDAHDTWQRATARNPDADQQRRRARRLALSLLDLGEPAEAVEHQLHRWCVHPAMAHEALRWAQVRAKGGASAPPADAAPDAAPVAASDRMSDAAVAPAAGDRTFAADGAASRAVEAGEPIDDLPVSPRPRRRPPIPPPPGRRIVPSPAYLPGQSFAPGDAA